MREILFRAKSINKYTGWVYGTPVFDENKQEYELRPETYTAFHIKQETLGQYTSVKDKNDKEVFDGDIIFLEEEHLYGKVCWENLRWYVYWYGWIDKEGFGTVYDIVNENPLSDELLTSEDKIWLPVVGNIYDNPEMLKGENLYG